MQATDTKCALLRVPVDPDGIPDWLKRRRQWVNWKFELRNGRYTKVPYIPYTGMRASATDLMTWTNYEVAQTAFEFTGEYDGLGFVFCSDDPFVGIDFDRCRDLQTGEVDPHVLAYIGRFESCHVEVSVSGTGVHLISRGKIRGGTRKGIYEIYDQERFFALTGVLLHA
jgi:primase-polymerase (primpol)-like protein